MESVSQKFKQTQSPFMSDSYKTQLTHFRCVTYLFKIFLFLIVCVHAHTCMGAYKCEYRYPQRPKKGIRFSRTGVEGYCEPPDIDSGN